MGRQWIKSVRSTADFFLDEVRDDVQYYRLLYNVSKVRSLRGPNALYRVVRNRAVYLTELLKKLF
jgi:Outer membrane receptor for monomeric catechols